jgi:hypothetical protein
MRVWVFANVKAVHKAFFFVIDELHGLSSF